MPETNPIPDAKLAELRRLHAAATPGEWRGGLHALHEEPSEYGSYCELETGERSIVGYIPLPDIQLCAALHNYFPSVIARLEAAERERDTATDDEAGHWIGIIRSLDPENLCDVFDGLGIEEHLHAWLAARDARMRHEGGIEALEDIAKDSGIDGGKAYMATVVYREFPDVLTTRVGVVEGADLLQAAQRLREGGK